MNVNRMLRIIAGLVIMLSLVLAHVMGQVNLTQMSWLWLTAFVGFNLFQSGFTNWCPMITILKMLGVKE
ncbi:MAG TPA: DUF2892 domain-containing protein [Gammaproteobacteria bacterium]|jgi:hypothetical protein|nr:DUF2892 domain-containing protein [Xanthomonadales bacterium]MCB1604366.1 DUF2892 domain-containing protein [Xanthomonadales bacterium]HOP23393.1 DUF2892 domain-containing protein [Gammaproteobacteria bacterium]HPI96521.1 DUF2892 domain-containing protein [Gammaproteobacteria bacterium]HPQ87111.1 DUF2892 domain-containing protein [Gammaproteobacteria bacterium]